MENRPNPIIIQDFITESGALYSSLPLSFTLSGRPLHTAPIVMVNHALTGNAQVTGENGWWNDLVGEEKTIDTNKYTVLAFNVPTEGRPHSRLRRSPGVPSCPAAPDHEGERT